MTSCANIALVEGKKGSLIDATNLAIKAKKETEGLARKANNQQRRLKKISMKVGETKISNKA